MSNPDTPTTIKIPNYLFFSPAFLVAMVRALGWRRGVSDWLTLMASVPAALVRFVGRDARRRWNSEPTMAVAEAWIKIGLPLGVAAVLIAIGNGFGL